jgi:hypothetical protein
MTERSCGSFVTCTSVSERIDYYTLLEKYTKTMFRNSSLNKTDERVV